MGYVKTRRNTVNTPAENLGTTAGAIAAFPEVTVITSTAPTVYQLPVPRSGLRKTVVVDFVTSTGDVTLANKSTATLLNGSTANVVTVSSSQEHAVFDLTGVTSGSWAVNWSVTPTTAVPGVTFAASTVTS